MNFIELENARIEVVRLVVQNAIGGETNEYVDFKIIDGYGREKRISVLRSDCVRNNDLIHIFEEQGVVFPSAPSEQRKIRTDILRLISIAKEDTEVIAPNGFFTYEGEWFCSFGNKILARNDSGTDKFKVAEASMTLRNFEEQDFLKACRYPFIDDEAAPMVFIAMILAVSDQFLEKAGLCQRYTTYIVGETGSYKSSIVRETTKIFFEKVEQTLSSSNAAIGNGFEHIPLVINLLDDFNETEFGQIKQKKGVKIAELIQMHADRAERAVMCGNKTKYTGTHSALVITAEQPLKNPSSVNRCLMASSSNVNLEFLTKIQNDNLNSGIFTSLLIEVINFFLFKLYQNYTEKIRANYMALPLKYRNFEEYRDVPGYSRIIESYRIARMGVLFWKDFFQHKAFDEVGEKVVQRLHRGLELSVERTLDYLQSVANPDIEILQKLFNHIKQGIRKGRFAKQIEKYDDEKHLGIVQKNKLYISGECLLEILKTDFGEDITKRKISSSLHNNGLLIFKGEKYSCSIPGSGSSKRFYCINLKKFKEFFFTDMDYVMEAFYNNSCMS